MTNPLLSNEINTDSVILWQYDKAYNLIKVLQKWEGFGKASCEDFWNYFGNNILPIDTADTFGLNTWGNLLGIPRPTINIPVGLDGGSDEVTDGYNEDGYMVLSVDDGWKVVTIKNPLYRALLKGRFFMMCHTPTVPNYNKFLSILFGAIANESGESPVYDIFNAEGDIQDGYASRNHVLDFQNMTMGFTFPKDATPEEAYLIFQHYDLVYPFPAGIRYGGEFINDELVIGLNTTQDEGQMYKAFVDGLVLAEDKSGRYPNGGIFAATDRANYMVIPEASGIVYIVQIADIPEGLDGVTINMTFSSLNSDARQTIWIDWGNGNKDGGYHYLPKGLQEGKTISTKYTERGLYAIIVLYNSSKVHIEETPDVSSIVNTYSLHIGKGE